MSSMNRRTFLGRTLQGAGAMAALQAVGGCAAARPSEPAPCPPHTWRKHGIVLEATESWEHGEIQNFTSPAEPLDGDRWRIWYTVHANNFFNIAYAEGVPGGPMKRIPARCTPGRPADDLFAVGHLPEQWKPVQIVHLRLTNGRHRIYFWAHGHEIARFLAADSDDGRRYTVVNPNRPVLYHPNDRAAYGVPSPDGVMLVETKSDQRPADEPLAPPMLISNDATNIYQLPDGTFEMYSVALVPVPREDPAYVEFDNAPGLLRVVDRYTSADGLRFETRQRVIQRDARDPVDQQFYYLAVTYTPKGRVGMLGDYPCMAQTMDLQWCFSADGLKWERPVRTPWLPRGDKSQVDSYGIYASHNIVHHQGRYHLFYNGVNTAHNYKASFGQPRSAIMYATADSIWL
jgi:hypothetical protein